MKVEKEDGRHWMARRICRQNHPTFIGSRRAHRNLT
jgi:hypothetical protein